jgi:hypothetical protein
MKRKDISRRDFIKQNSLAGLGIIGACGIAGSIVSQTASASPSIKDQEIKTISDLNLEQLRQRYREALFGRFIPNMDSLVIDHELGGFMCSVDILTRKLISTNKRTWFEGRGIWRAHENPKTLF